MSVGRAQDILIGPRTTVYALLLAYPFLESYLLARVRGFERLRDRRARTRWARVMTLDDVGARLNVPWRQLVREIAAEVEQGTGQAGTRGRRPAAGRRRRAPHRGAPRDRRRAGGRRVRCWRWRRAGASPPATSSAPRWPPSTPRSPRRRAPVAPAASAWHGPRAAPGDVALADPPPGHPVETLRREARQILLLTAGLRAEMDRLGGSPPRRRWQRAKPLVSRLADRLSAVELRFRREQQAWFPALEVLGIEGPQALLAARQGEALETLRRLRLAVDRDDAPSAVEAGTRLVDALDDLLAQDERLLEPLALRHFSAEDWAAVRELEDGVGVGSRRAAASWPDS